MAIGVMNWVWTHSRSRHGARLVLLAIADCASGDGANAWPSVAELKRKAGLSERAVHTAIGELVKLGELEVQYNAGPKGCNRYRVIMTPADSAPPQILHPPAKSAPLQNSTPTPAKSAPVTIKDPSLMVDRLDALANELAAIPGEDDLILKAVIGMIHERTGEVIEAARARLVAEKILNGRRTTDRVAYIRKAIRNERNPRARFLADELTGPVSARPDWCGNCDQRTRQREDGEGNPFRCPECSPTVKAS